eukprot:546844-Pelagomonas_calceolata.AAC.1
MAFLLCANDAHAGKFKTRSMCFSCVGVRGYVLKDKNTPSYFGLYLVIFHLHNLACGNNFLLLHDKKPTCQPNPLLPPRSTQNL